MTPKETKKNSNPSSAKNLTPYDSNPFTLSFRAFSLLLDYARGVFFVTLVFGFLGFTLHTIDNLGSLNENQEINTEIGSNNPVVDINAETIVLILVVAVIVLTLIIVISLLISSLYKGFVAAGAVAATEKRNITIGQAFSEMTDRFSVLFYAQAIALSRIVGGYLLLIIPGIRAQLRYEPLVYIIMSDKKLKATEAVEASKNLYNKHLMEVFGINTVGAIIPVVGSSISASGLAMSVQQLKAYAKANEPTPKTHFLNYIGVILLAFLFLIFLLLIAVALAFYTN